MHLYLKLFEQVSTCTGPYQLPILKTGPFEVQPSKSLDFKFFQNSDPRCRITFLSYLCRTFLFYWIGPSLVPTSVVIESLTYWQDTLQKSSIENTKLILGRQKEVWLIMLWDHSMIIICATKWAVKTEQIGVTYSNVYSGDLITKLVWYLNGRKEIECQMVWFSNAIWIPDCPTI